ncbi:MAG: molybdopterin biosynthesis protein [Halobacteriaceae archaeon]
MSRKEFRDLASPEATHEAIDALDIGGGTEAVPLGEARGRVLAERVEADIDVPGFDRSALDGYAVRAADTVGASEGDPADLAVVGAVHPGHAPDLELGPGEAAEISTGAPMPSGADAMVPVERVAVEGGRVAVRTAVAPGENVMLAGADIAAGERALGPGVRLGPREIGLLSALGVTDVPVRERPRVAVISTGDELVRPGERLDHAAGEIHDVNSYTVAAGVEEAGGEAALYPHVGDDPGAMTDHLLAAADEVDLVLSSGSLSASTVDAIYEVIEEHGELLLHGVAVKPGKPTLVGRLAGAAYVGLPGYPVSALTIFRTFVAPAIREAAGRPDPPGATLSGEMALRERYAEGRLRYVPVGLVEDGDGGLLVYPVDKGSGATTSLAEADGVVEMGPDTALLDRGERVTVELFSPADGPPAVFGAGEDDPALSRLLDAVERPRYLGVGTRGGVRWLRDGVADVAVVAGPGEVDVEAVELGSWSREWGLVVPAGNPQNVGGVADLVDRDVGLVNRPTTSGLRSALGAAVAALADERGVERQTLVGEIRGFERTARAHASPARKVAAGAADAGLGLRATAADLGLGFVRVDDQRVRVLGNPDRAGKPGVESLRAAVEGADDVLAELPGFGR